MIAPIIINVETHTTVTPSIGIGPTSSPPVNSTFVTISKPVNDTTGIVVQQPTNSTNTKLNVRHY